MSDSLGVGRWAAKKLSRRLFVLGARAVEAMRRPDTYGMRALMYHRVRSVARDPFSVRPDHFDAQMGWLARERIALTLADVEDVIAGRRRPRRGSVLVTIDDGYRDAYLHVLPTLSRHRIPAVLFVSVAAIEERDGPPSAARAADAHLSWTELMSLARAGVAIASHGWEHRSLTQMSLAEAQRQMVRSRTTLEARLGSAVRAFAYPFGTQADFNAETRSALLRSGYACAFTAQHGAIGAGSDAFVLPRIKVEGGESLSMFRRLVAGGLDGWAVVDRHFWRLQARRVVPS